MTPLYCNKSGKIPAGNQIIETGKKKRVNYHYLADIGGGHLVKTAPPPRNLIYVGDELGAVRSRGALLPRQFSLIEPLLLIVL